MSEKDLANLSGVLLLKAIEDAIRQERINVYLTCAKRCEEQRLKILRNTADPSYTEHLAECSMEFMAEADRLRSRCN